MSYFWKKATEEYSPGAHRQWGLNYHTLQLFKNKFLSRNLDQNMLYFLEKAGKNCRSVLGAEPPTPADLWRLVAPTPGSYSH